MPRKRVADSENIRDLAGERKREKQRSRKEEKKSLQTTVIRSLEKGGRWKPYL